MNSRIRLSFLLFLLFCSALALAAVRPATCLLARLAVFRLEASPEVSKVEGMGVAGTCGAGVRFAHVISTARHCFVKRNPDTGSEELYIPRDPVVGDTLYLNGKPRKILEFVYDGADHVLVRVDGAPFPHVPTYSNDALPDVGADVFVWGAPIGLTSLMLRRGSVGGGDERVNDDTNTIPKGTIVRWLDLTGGPGDSGSPVFDSNGRVVGVVSYGISPYKFLGLFPVAFTSQQLAEIQQ